MRVKLTLGVCLVFLINPFTLASEYIKPTLKGEVELRYPQTNAKRSREGWVDIQVMVDEHGNASNPVILNSTGNDLFEAEATRAMLAAEYTPPLLDGEPISGAVSYKVIFAKQGEFKGLRPSFGALYRDIAKATAANDKEKADKALKELREKGVHTLYEDSWLNYATFIYGTRWLTQEQQRNALIRALANEKKSRYLDKSSYQFAVESLFRIELQTGRYAEALNTWEDLKQTDLPENKKAQFEQLARRITEIQNSDGLIATDAVIDRTIGWNLLLLKRHFSISEADEGIRSVTVLCDRKRYHFDYKPDTQYEVPEGLGDCRVQVKGEPGAKFKLLQT